MVVTLWEPWYWVGHWERRERGQRPREKTEVDENVLIQNLLKGCTVITLYYLYKRCYGVTDLLTS